MTLIGKGGKTLLLILLASFLSVISSISKNPHYDKFLREHLDFPRNSSGPEYCDDLMRLRRMTVPCQETNSFIHEPPNRVKTICTWGGSYYHNRNRLSSFNVSVTTCFLQRSAPGRCFYTYWSGRRQVIIACDKKGWPVHFEETNFI